MKAPWILSRYFVTRFFKWFLIATLGVCCLIFLFDLSEMARRASSKQGVTLFLLLKITLLKLPSLIERLLPFVVLFSTMMTLWSLNRQHELEVARASGISIWQILRPILLGALAIACFDLVLINPFSASMMLEYERLESTFLSDKQGSLAISDTGLWARERYQGAQTVYHVRALEPQEQSLVQVSLIKSDLDDRFVQRIDAQEGTFKNKMLHLKYVWISLPGQAPTFHDQLVIPSSFNFESLLESGMDPKSLSFWELPKFMNLLKKSGLSTLKYDLHWHTLLARVLWLCVMVLLAAACSLRPLRQGGTFMLAASGLVVSFLLYFAGDVSQTLGATGKLPVILAAWGPAWMSALVGFSVLLYSEDG
jgi:lipopolysaccharide export system permease protein